MKRSIKIIQCDGSAKCVKKLLTVMLGILLVLSLTACRSDAEPEETPAPQPPDLTGQWCQVNNETEDSYYGAIISDEQIEIYWVSNNGNTRSLYWAGSFVAPDTADEPYSWESQKDTESASTTMLDSTENTKGFTYTDNKIVFSASTGSSKNVRLEKEEWAPGLTIGAGATPDETAAAEATESVRPADVTYTPFSIAGVEFSIPSYYEKIENSTAEGSTFEFYHENGGVLARLILGSGNATITQQEFDENKDALTDGYIKNMGTVKVVESKDITLAGLSARCFSYLGINNENVMVGGYNTFTYNIAENKSLFVMLVLSNSSPSFVTDDYNKIIGTAKLLTSMEPDNSAIESDGTSAPTSGLRPEFKEAMDTYEAFYRDYCDLLKKYSQNPGDLTLLQEYMNMLTKVQEMDKAFDEWDQDDMNSEELKYYLEVHTRILQMLADVNS